MFLQATISFDENPFQELSKSANFEDVAPGRKGAVLVSSEYGDFVPIVRTTTIYQKSASRFSALHMEIIEKIRACFAFPEFGLSSDRLNFNNALIEIYDSNYRTMKFHSDQALDLKEGYICLFSCYDGRPEQTAKLTPAKMSQSLRSTRAQARGISPKLQAKPAIFTQYPGTGTRGPSPPLRRDPHRVPSTRSGGTQRKYSSSRENAAYTLTPKPVSTGCERDIWESVATFPQLQAATALFIQGNVQNSYYHPRLDVESELILDELTALNLSGLVTLNSQAHVVGWRPSPSGEEGSEELYQTKPFLDGLYPADRVEKLSALLFEKYDLDVIRHVLGQRVPGKLSNYILESVPYVHRENVVGGNFLIDWQYAPQSGRGLFPKSSRAEIFLRAGSPRENPQELPAHQASGSPQSGLETSADENYKLCLQFGGNPTPDIEWADGGGLNLNAILEMETSDIALPPNYDMTELPGLIHIYSNDYSNDFFTKVLRAVREVELEMMD